MISVPETVGSAAALLSTHDPLAWAAVLERLLIDDELRTALISAGHQRVEYFSEDNYRDRLGAALSSIGITP